MSSVSSWGSIWDGLKDIDFQGENYTWSIYESLLGKDYDFKGKRIVEIGCGTGINTCVMARLGARVSFVDYSKDALKIVKKTMDRMGIDGELIQEDAFNLDLEGYDISHSEGVIEHFKGKRRQGIVDVHSGVLRKGGRCIITVPQAASAPYRIGKRAAELTGTWIYGNEYPYTMKELRRRMERSGLSVGRMIGGEFLFSFGWVFAPLWLKKSRVLKSSISMRPDRRMKRLNYDNFLANRFGRVIAASGEKR